MNLKQAYRSLLYRAAKKYVAGPELEDAMRICHRAAQHGWSCTIGPWDEVGESPEEVLSRYEQTLLAMATARINAYLSIKVPSLGFNENLLARLLELAEAHHIRIHFDSLAPETAGPSLKLLETMRPRSNYLSYTLPARWPRSLEDAGRMVELGIAVRVVKGQWEDPAKSNLNVEHHFMAIVKALAGKVPLVGVATHDIALAAKALDCLQRAGTPAELEQLFGLPLRVDAVARPREVPVRIYVPFGHAYLSYAVRKVLNPRIMGWFIRDLISTSPRGRELAA